jgi:hypothetical protein
MSLEGVAERAEPYQVRRENLFPHPEEHHADYLAGVIFRVDLGDRTAGGAKTAGEANLDILSPRLLSDFVLELGIELV